MLKGGSSKNFVDIDADPTLLEGSKCEVWKEDSKNFRSLMVCLVVERK
jgi:hypothetical protein